MTGASLAKDADNDNKGGGKGKLDGLSRSSNAMNSNEGPKGGPVKPNAAMVQLGANQMRQSQGAASAR